MLKKMFLGAILATTTSAVWATGEALYAKLGSHVTSMTLSYVDWWNVTQTNTYSNSEQDPGLVTDEVKWAGYGVAVHGITVENGYQAHGFSVLDYYFVDTSTGYATATNNYSGTTGNYTTPKAPESSVLTVIANDATPIDYSISYDWNGGTPPSAPYAMSYTIEDPDLTLPEPTRTGHDFKGWYEDSDFSGDPVATIPSGSVSNRTFYAKWTPQVFSVALKFNGGPISINGEQVSVSPFVTNYTYGVGLTLPAFERIGYQPGGWHLLQDCSDPFVTSIGTTETGDKEFWAKLTEQSYTVTLDNQDADVSGTSSVSVRYNGDFPASINCPTKAGYEFKGYFAEVDGQGTQYYKEDGTAYGNAWATADGGTIYAHWQPHAYELSFAPGEDGSGAMASMALTYGVATNLPPVEFVREGYVFAGWQTNLTVGATFADGQAVSNLTTVADGKVTMTATWTKGFYYVAFDANGGDGAMDVQKFTYDVSAPLSTNAFARVGFDFAGWAWTSTATTNDIAFTNCETVSNLVAVVDSTNTLYAVWKPESYDVVLDANEGGYFLDGEVTNLTKTIRVTYGTAYDLPVPSNVKAWKTFAGWKYIDGTGAAQSLPDTAPLFAAGITNMIAQWTDGLKAALNAPGTDLDYATGGYNESQHVEMGVSWSPVGKDGVDVGQSGELPDGVNSCYTYVRTTLPGEGVLSFRWRIQAPAGYYENYDPYDETQDVTNLKRVGNWLFFCRPSETGSTDNLAELVSGISSEKEWNDTGWQTVSFTNNTQESLDVEWRFQFAEHVYVIGGGTGWVDNVTWTPAGEPPPVLAEIVHAVTSYDGTYDGAGHGIAVNVTQPASGATVKYALDAEGPYAEGEILFTNVTETAETVWYTIEAENYTTVTNSGTVKISPKTLTDAMVSLAETSYTHDGTAKEPAVTVEDGELSIILTANDYDVAYSNNIEVGEATVVVAGKGNYAGEVLKHFTISSADDPPPTPAAIDYTATPYDETYDGAGHGITVSVTTPESGAVVKFALDAAGPYAEDPILFTNVTETTVWYTVEAASYATVTNSGTVKISPKALTEKMVSLAETSYTYDGNAKEPAVTVADGSSILTAADYDVVYSNNVAVGEATVVVAGKGNYTGEVLKNFTITSMEPPLPAEIVHAVLSYEGVYDGEGHGITVSVTTPESGWIVKYALDEAGPYAEEPILFTDVTETAVTVWYTVEAENYATVTNNGTVKISPKTSPDDFVIPGYGSVKIPKTWKVGQKVTWKAVAAKGSVFAHWEGDFVDSLKLSTNELRNPSLPFVVPESFDTNDIQAVFIAVDSDKLYELALTQTEFELKEPVSGVWVEDDSKSYVTASASGLPTGLKFNAKTLEITGTPTKSGIYWVQVKAKNASGYQWAENFQLTVSGGGKEAKEPKLTRTAYYPLTVLSTNAVAGTVTGTGVYAEGKKASIKATAAKKYVFAGWYRDMALKEPMAFASGDFRTASQSVVVPDARYLFARFATEEDDKNSLMVNIDDAVTEKDGSIGTVGTDGTRALDLGACVESLSLPKLTVSGLPKGLKYDAKTLKITGKATKPGVYTVKVAATNTSIKKATDETTATFTITVPNFECAALPRLLPATDAYGTIYAGVTLDTGLIDCTPENGWTVKVTGLPTGLKFAAKDTKDAALGMISAGTVYGVPTAKAGSYTVTFTASKKGEANQVATITFNIEALPFWAVGTFDGVVDDGALVSLTVAANGKISGKLLEGGKTWTLAAAAFGSYDEVGEAFESTVVGKSGKEVLTNAVVVTAGTVLDSVRGVATSDSWTAWQNLWKTEPWKAYAKPFTNKKLTLSGVTDGLPSAGDTLTLKFAATGAVTASGKFVTGQDAKGKDVVYSASCSSVLIPESEVRYTVYLYFPPKAGKFDGYAMELPLEWNGTGFILSE